MITSAVTATGTAGAAFSYQITGSNGPTSYGTARLPSSLWVNLSTGLISGTLPAAGTTVFTVTATNSSGTGSANVTLTVNSTSGVPAITSATTASGTVGSSFSYQITASNSPTSYGATGLPSGLSVNTGTGLISGTPMAAGTSTVTLSATNSSGTGSAAMTLTITRPREFRQSPAPRPRAERREAVFSYQITGSNWPTSYGTARLPTVFG